MRGFASDNLAPAHPAVLRALARANRGHAPAYGDDALTLRVRARVARLFGPRAEAHFVLTGTAANVIGLRAFTDSWHAVYCAASSHLNRHECAAPETFLGAKLVAVPAPGGKLTPEALRPLLQGFGDPHEAQPRAVSVSQATELGTVYRPAELRALARLVRRHGMILHVDGARLANAAAALGVSLGEACAGADVVSFGGTKNGLLGAEAVVFRRPAPAFPFLRKQGLQLASKMRYVAAQFEALLDGSLWLRNARRANAMARRLEAAVRGLPGLEITRPVESNAVFARLPRGAAGRLRRRFAFYDWDARRGEVRWMTSFDTRPGDVDAFAAAIRRELISGRAAP
jgi:threonine aldolase